MNYLIFYILGGLIIFPIIYAYYLDYKNDPEDFKLSIKALFKGSKKALILFLICFCINELYKCTIPFNQDTGLEFNPTREKLGIPILDQVWEINESESSQFKTYWWHPKPDHGHFKKEIVYSVLKIKTETDYYQNKARLRTFAWSVFNFDNQTFEYYIEAPNDNEFPVNKEGKLQYKKTTTIRKVHKSEFDRYIAE